MAQVYKNNAAREAEWSREAIRFARKHANFWLTGAAVEALYQIQSKAVQRAQREGRIDFVELRAGGRVERIMRVVDVRACWPPSGKVAEEGPIDDLIPTVLGGATGGADVIFDVAPLIGKGTWQTNKKASTQ